MKTKLLHGTIGDRAAGLSEADYGNARLAHLSHPFLRVAYERPALYTVRLFSRAKEANRGTAVARRSTRPGAVPWTCASSLKRSSPQYSQIFFSNPAESG